MKEGNNESLAKIISLGGKQLRSENERLKKELARVKKELDGLKTRFKERLAKAKKEYKQAFEDGLWRAQITLRDEKEEALRKFAKAYEKKIQEVNQEHEQELQKLKEKHQEELKKVIAERNRFNRAINSLHGLLEERDAKIIELRKKLKEGKEIDEISLIIDIEEKK